MDQGQDDLGTLDALWDIGCVTTPPAVTPPPPHPDGSGGQFFPSFVPDAPSATGGAGNAYDSDGGSSIEGIDLFSAVFMPTSGRDASPLPPDDDGTAAASTEQLEKQLLDKFSLAGLQAERKKFAALKKGIASSLTPEEKAHLKKLRRKVLSRGYAAGTKKRQKNENVTLKAQVKQLKADNAALRAALAAAQAAAARTDDDEVVISRAK